MSIFDVFKRSKKPERRDMSMYGGGLKLSEIVNKNNPTVIFCENLIANTIATLPFYLYRQFGKATYPQYDNPLYRILTKRPNLNETPSVFISSLVRQILAGNGFIKVIRSDGNVSQLIVLDNKLVKIETVGLQKQYYYNGELQKPGEIIHIPGAYGYDGVKGKAVIEYAQQIVSASDILNLYTRNYFENLIFSKLKIDMNKTSKKELTDDDIKAIAEFYTNAMTGENINRPVVQFDGMEVTPMDLKSNGTQELNESRNYLDRLICQVYGVPYSLLSENNKYNSYEQFNLFFRSHTLTQYTDRIEQYLTNGLLVEQEQESMFFKCDYSELLTPDSEAKNKLVIEKYKNAILTLDEARDELGLPPSADKVAGQTHILSGFGVVRQDVIEAWAASAKLKQKEVDAGGATDNKGK